MVVGLAATLIAGNANSENYNDGNFLLEKCTATLRVIDGRKISSSDDQLGMGQCIGLVEGVRNTLIYVNNEFSPDVKICWPEKGISNGQAIRILVKYLNDHPANLNMEQTFLTIVAFKDAYPCKK